MDATSPWVLFVHAFVPWEPIGDLVTCRHAVDASCCNVSLDYLPVFLPWDKNNLMFPPSGAFGSCQTSYDEMDTSGNLVKRSQSRSTVLLYWQNTNWLWKNTSKQTGGQKFTVGRYATASYNNNLKTDQISHDTWSRTLRAQWKRCSRLHVFFSEDDWGITATASPSPLHSAPSITWLTLQPFLLSLCPPPLIFSHSCLGILVLHLSDFWNGWWRVVCCLATAVALATWQELPHLLVNGEKWNWLKEE